MKKKSSFIIIVIGITLIVCGIVLIKTIEDPNELMLTLPYICVGVGCGVFGHGMGNIISLKTAQNNPEFQKQMDILRKDERNVMISNRAKAKGYDLMTYAFGALLLVFTLMGVDLIPLLLLVLTYLSVQLYALYHRIKFDKEM